MDSKGMHVGMTANKLNGQMLRTMIGCCMHAHCILCAPPLAAEGVYLALPFSFGSQVSGGIFVWEWSMLVIECKQDRTEQVCGALYRAARDY